ncbi:bifunctional phosphopantothenoylcysteine decarboxylase/phosphopantothenate--cysteine ligase CoaBC [Exiguobacterium sp. SH3S2]|uniref:bifunctional phosphopantothenoylcysteine decarboxylase/phosphopantothenate--cysteine ligase CoaBC n=1 Tax=unclassified Exiguobacterium TaxID=2644629 RepID=UPI00103B9791|nr:MULTISPECIES: bifunctional phosphopantothenoylcysteine decarboxylase/phosphopantothenate--cysteine ligase CoaBC [unclassified Exiguobacterium]TCI37399.1 bifunctional phosphopantothenoylcysteine decarboxylase/phosphopantothenate--cysteine ligase CoaBC [Exiguobacterium sp. SH4S7]TCI49194.1 bifunctional phosphopantothenoylcysteine decarboxylase/phosphopantothenate--cysteine ligase CoaBC [Exiguobacterium sp. SH3S3]TCI64507.1 bifunctional phosphopantothenoylcysteine decarboxylase/phosphopantothena
MVNDRNILLCVSGGIAAYKACALTSKLVQAGANVRVAMTASAEQFVGKATFQALSRNPIYSDVFEEHDPTKIAHIDVVDTSDLIVVAPATANIIAKLANGIADDFITTSILAAKCPVIVSPAMNVNMLEHPATRRNIETLKSYGYQIIEPGVGNLACGWIGGGRLPEPEDLVRIIASQFVPKHLLEKHVLITAGPTVERIDPVRFLSNDSSGKMGVALAEAARDMGANVTLVHGPLQVPVPDGVTAIAVESGQQMLETVLERFATQDIVIKSAAVADYRPKTVHTEKHKKVHGPLTIELEETTDILKELGTKKTHQLLVGFAAETEQLEDHARAKLERKNVDFLVANDVSKRDIGFRSDDNEVVLFRADGSSVRLPRQSKQRLAHELLAYFKEGLR